MSAGQVADDTVQEILRRSNDLVNAPYAVGIAILPFRLVGVITDLSGANRGVGRWELPEMEVPNVVQGCAELARYLVRTSLGFDLPNPRIRIGLQIGGPVDTATGTALYYINPLDSGPDAHQPWVNIPLADYVQEVTGCPTTVDNDAHALAAYELKLGGLNASTFVLLFINDGVGASVVLDNKLLPAPIEFGHLQVCVEDRKCECQNSGCIDAQAGRRAIRSAVSEATKIAGIDSVERAAEFADRNDDMATKAIKAFSTAGESIARGAGAMLTLFGPSHLVIYGPEVLVGFDRNSPATESFLTEVNKFRNYAYPPFRDCEVVRRPLPPHPDSDRGAHGAALIALHRHFYAPLGSHLEHSI